MYSGVSSMSPRLSHTGMDTSEDWVAKLHHLLKKERKAKEWGKEGKRSARTGRTGAGVEDTCELAFLLGFCPRAQAPLGAQPFLWTDSLRGLWFLWEPTFHPPRDQGQAWGVRRAEALAGEAWAGWSPEGSDGSRFSRCWNRRAQDDF